MRPFSHGEHAVYQRDCNQKRSWRFQPVRHYLLCEAVLSHFSVAFGVLLLTAVVAISPQGKTFATAAPPPVETAIAVQTSPGAMQPETSGPAFSRNGVAVSSRGSRGERPAATSTPGAATAPAAPSPVGAAAASTEAPSRSPLAQIPVPMSPVTPPAGQTPFHVGIQAGHWKESELPAELASLRGETGAVGNGWREVDINLSVANSVAALLRQNGVVVDVLPATVPVDHKADAFLAIHGDANDDTTVSGFKMARARWSKIPQKDDALIADVSAEYRAATGLPEHLSTITENMRQYYAFNWIDLKHAVAPTTPSAIIELGFLTTAGDREVILEHQDRVASGIARGIIRFLTGR